MATLWEMMVFSESSKFWKTSGLRTFCTPAVSVSSQLKDKLLACHRERICTHAENLISSKSQRKSNCVRQPFTLHNQAAYNQQA
jgi:hypothetical protein